MMPLANTFFVDDVPPPWQRGERTLKGVTIKNPTSRHPLMCDLSGLDEIAFVGGFRFDPRTDEVKKKDEGKKEEEVEMSVRDEMRKVVPTRNRLLEAAGETVLMFVLQRRAIQRHATLGGDSGDPPPLRSSAFHSIQDASWSPTSRANNQYRPS